MRVSFDLMRDSNLVGEADALVARVEQLLASRSLEIVVPVGATQATSPDGVWHIYGAVEVEDGSALHDEIVALWTSGAWANRIRRGSKVFLDYVRTAKA